MQFQEGATVLTSTGEKVGKVHKIVLDPATRDVTHLVVSKGLLLTRDSLVPIGDVTGTPGGETVLLDEGAQPGGYQAFEGVRYTTDPGGRERRGESAFEVYAVTGVPPLYPGGVGPVPAPAEPPREESAATGASVIESGTPVLSEDGRKIGKVEEVVTRDDGSIDSLVARSGILWLTRHRVIPVGWIKEIRSSEIRLSVPKDQVMSAAQKPTGSIGQRPPGR